MSNSQFIFVTVAALLTSAACGCFFMAWFYGRRKNRMLEGSIGEMRKASKAMADTRIKEVKEHALENLETADREFEDAINNPRDSSGGG